ncbi:AvrE-family type 3 secretion system effector [Pseudomonas sp.]|uniref:AvrE-family type 3 secretion system effector n=1 Tax=Pseudomonas sp. TaxID=306 RepID=UPI00262F1156|nr:AvrE-family type 3 secretion system effector [Pseudomonas sp.]
MPLTPTDSLIAGLSRRSASTVLKHGNDVVKQNLVTRSFGKKCLSLFQRGRDGARLPELTQFRSYRPASLVFGAAVRHGKVTTQGSAVGQDIAGQLNQLPKRFMEDPQGSGKGLRLLDEKLNVFYIQSSPSLAAVLKSSHTQGAQPLRLDNPGLAHLAVLSGVHTTRNGDQFRLADQRLFRFEPQTLSWQPDSDKGTYSRLGLTKEGALMKVPSGVSDMSCDGKNTVVLKNSQGVTSLDIGQGKGELTPVSTSGQAVVLAHIGVSGSNLYGSTPDGQLLRGDLQKADGGRLHMEEVSSDRHEQLFKGSVNYKGFMHGDDGQLNALLTDTHQQLHSIALTEAGKETAGWNLSDVMLKVIDRGMPEPGPRVLAGAVDLGQRGKVALEGDRLLCWDQGAQRWDKTSHDKVNHLGRGLDGCAYVLQEGLMKRLDTEKNRAPVQMGASYELAPPNAARTQVKFNQVMAGDTERAITAFAVSNGKNFVSLDDKNQLRAHVDGKETALHFTRDRAVQALALDHLGNLYAQTPAGELLRLDKADWQSSAPSDVTWAPVMLPKGERLESLAMGPDQHLVGRWEGRDQRLNISAEGALEWEPIGLQPTPRSSSLGALLRGGEIRGQFDVLGGTNVSVTTSVAGQQTEGVDRKRGYLDGLQAHFNPKQGLKNIGLDIQHHFKGRAGLEGLYADDKAIRGQLKGLANARPATQDISARLEQLSLRALAPSVVQDLKTQLMLVETNSQSAVNKLGDLKGVSTLVKQPGDSKRAKESPGSTLHQLHKAFENVSPSSTVAASLRRYESQGVVLPSWSADKPRDTKNPTALVESDLIHHALTLSKLSQLTAELEKDNPDTATLSASLKAVMKDYHDNTVHKKAAQNINSYAQAEGLYKNFKILAKDLGTPGSALHFHISRTLGLGQSDSVKQALMQEIQQSETGQAISSARGKGVGASLASWGTQPVPVLEFTVGVSASSTNGITITRTDKGANIDIASDLTKTGTASVGAGITRLPLEGVIDSAVRLGAEAGVSVAHGKGASISFEIAEADFPQMMDILTGEQGNVYDLLDLGAQHTSTESSKWGADLNASAFAQGRAFLKVSDNSGAFEGVVRSALGVTAKVNVAHLDASRSRTQGNDSVTEALSRNAQFLRQGAVGANAGLVNTVLSAQVEPQGTTLAGFSSPDVSFSVNFDRSKTGSFNFTFKQTPAVEPSQINDVRTAVSSFLGSKVQLPSVDGVDTGEQLRSLKTLLDQHPASAVRKEAHFAVNQSLQDLLRQHELSSQGQRRLMGVERTVNHIGLSGDGKHSWLNATSPDNKAAIVAQLSSQPLLADVFKELEKFQGASVSIGLEVKPETLRMIERKVADGREALPDVEKALKDPDNLRIKSMSVSYKASRSHGMSLPIPVLSFNSSATLGHSQKVLNAEFQYGSNPDAPLTMKFNTGGISPEKMNLDPELHEQRIRGLSRPEF